MSALDTAKEIVRIGSAAGLSKDVIDLLEKKVSLLVDENTVLSTKVSSLEIENRQLRAQLQNLHPVSHKDEQLAVLRVLATKEDYWKPAEVAALLCSDVVRVHSLLAKLKLEDLVFETMQGFYISSEGRASLL